MKKLDKEEVWTVAKRWESDGCGWNSSRSLEGIWRRKYMGMDLKDL